MQRWVRRARDRRPRLHQPAPRARRAGRRWWPRCCAAGERFGRQRRAPAERVMVEFVSANPTGPLHVGHGRQARARRRASATCSQRRAGRCTREFYYNDAGVQIANAGRCRCRRALRGPEARRRRLARGRPTTATTSPTSPPTSWRGKTVRADDREFTASGDVDDLDGIRQFAVAYLRHEQDLDLQAFGVRFDHYYLESQPVHRRPRRGRRCRRLVDRRQDLRGRRRAVAAHHRLRRRQGPRDAQVRRHATPTSCPTSPTTSTKFERGFAKVDQRAGHRPPRHGRARARRAAGRAASASREGYPDYVLHKMVHGDAAAARR
ncbi:MAG: hypothetical protein MZW92_04515 [Comamonadaceae bacterium]|nr:hypothetical protein [Comamonadaceae bacterium]